MGISPATVVFLRSREFDAVHLLDANLGRLPDTDVLDKAYREGRILLTHDLDFGELLAASGANLPSVIVFRLQNMRPERVNRYLSAVLEEHKDALKHGAIISINEGRIRIKKLPITDK